MGAGLARPPRNWSGSVTVLAVIAAIALAMPAVDRVPASRTGGAGIPFPVSAAVSVVPPAGSTVDLSVTRTGVSKGIASFRIGPVRYLVVVGPYAGTVAGAAYEARDKIMSSPGYQVTAQECYLATNSGMLGRWGGFAALGWSGIYAVFVVNGLRIEVTASGTAARLNLEMAGIERSIRTVAYQVPR